MDAARKVLAELDPELEWIHETYRDLHRHPELSLEETRTSALVVRKLEEFGYRVHRVGGTGVVGVLDNGPGRTVLARADMDALPVREATGLDYASENDGVMHACGHDVHVAALLGAAKLLADHREQWAGTYLALFQPAEETAQGSAAMLADGLADKIPAPDVAFAQHVMAQPAGSLQTVAGPVLSAGDSIRITVHGQGAHGSMPQLSVDPVVLAAAIVLRLQSVVSREVQPGEFAVLTIGSVQVGTKSNIIADRATLLLNLRSYDNAMRETLIAAVERIVRGECAAAGSPVEPEFEYYDQFPLTTNDEAVTERVSAAFEAYFGTVGNASRQSASEDFSRIPDAFGVPYSYWLLGGMDPQAYAEGKAAANHSPHFAPLIEPTLARGVEAMVIAALGELASDPRAGGA
ncbi:amidohydrolase [Arthrobacter sp. MYb229]|uniref:amidohydrolase n=1 Tax=unclassified Arthrobacter TaxID=235627 RepID=UPI000CFBB98D|nr:MULTISPECIES: amidohydrolase [unclassified Arthrobacter]PRA04029.1 amidohydrolase [Arthrobacter sp. MYb229]PRB52059.1 amidohydrolase [Arthrobacter sp. MYb216]